MNFRLFRAGKVWHYAFQIDGRRVRRSTRETSHQRANAVAARAFREAALWSRNGRAMPTLRETVAQWLEANAPIMSSSHIANIKRFGRLYLYDLGDIMLDELTTELVERARNAHLQEHAPSTTNLWLRAIRLLCNWAVARKIIPAVPFNVKLLKLQSKPKVILNSSMASAWLAAVDEHEDGRSGVATAVRLMIGIGLREAETISARWEWIDFSRQTYTPGITKGREADPLPMPSWLQHYLRPFCRPSGLIVTKPDGKPYTRGYTRRAMLHANAQCGAGHITAHRLRGTYATRLSEAGAPIASVQRAMRHKSPITTMSYLEPDLHFIARSQERMAKEFGFDNESSVSDKATAKNEPGSHAASDLPNY
jgi:integrase/recombinase XerC